MRMVKTKHLIEYIRDNYKSKSAYEMSVETGVHWGRIQKELDAIVFIYENNNKMSNYDMSLKLGVSVTFVHQRRRILGLSGKRKTGLPREIKNSDLSDFILSNYYKMSLEDMRKHHASYKLDKLYSQLDYIYKNHSSKNINELCLELGVSRTVVVLRLSSLVKNGLIERKASM